MAVAIFDGHYLLHRVMHVPHLRMLATKDGKPTGGSFGFIKSLRSTVGAFSEIRRCVVVFDGGHSKRRKSLYEGYKNRKSSTEVDPDGLSYSQKFRMQLNYLKFVLPRLGVKVVLLPNREGDDVVGLLAKSLDDALKIVVSDDRDMYQLIDEDVHVWRPLKEQRVSLMNFEEIAKCRKEHFLLRKACLGDASDTIPGIKGVGEKTIDDILSVCEDIGEYPHSEFFETAMDMQEVKSSKRVQRVIDNLDIVIRNYELVDISQETFTPEELTHALTLAAQRSDFDVLAVKRIFMSLEFYSLVDDFSRWVTPFQMLR